VAVRKTSSQNCCGSLECECNERPTSIICLWRCSLAPIYWWVYGHALWWWVPIWVRSVDMRRYSPPQSDWMFFMVWLNCRSTEVLKSRKTFLTSDLSLRGNNHMNLMQSSKKHIASSTTVWQDGCWSPNISMHYV
jgi:hypothetical protein